MREKTRTGWREREPGAGIRVRGAKLFQQMLDGVIGQDGEPFSRPFDKKGDNLAVGLLNGAKGCSARHNQNLCRQRPSSPLHVRQEGLGGDCCRLRRRRRPERCEAAQHGQDREQTGRAPVPFGPRPGRSVRARTVAERAEFIALPVVVRVLRNGTVLLFGRRQRTLGRLERGVVNGIRPRCILVAGADGSIR